MSDVKEIIARAIRRTPFDQADAVLSDLEKAGMVIVPKEPTDEMLEACWRAVRDCPVETRMAMTLAPAQVSHKLKMQHRCRAMLSAHFRSELTAEVVK